MSSCRCVYRRTCLEKARSKPAFQRGWRQSRDERFAEYVAPDGRSGEEAFDALRERLVTAKDGVITDQPCDDESGDHG